ncbi:MAG TPA: hypothetical protein VNN73_17610 [Blastocatellia bacterium]|nr:hypothetical protein [Blastocatellia bacterium]
MAQIILSNMTESKSATEGQIHEARVKAKKLEIKLAGAKLAQAEFYLDLLKARVDYLEARAARGDAITKREQAELEWVREALPVNSATVERLAAELERQRRELELILADFEETELALRSLDRD